MRIPKYRRHSARNFGFIEHEGKRHRLPGSFNSPESLLAYSEFIRGLSELEPLAKALNKSCTIEHLSAAYLEYAEMYYSRSEFQHCHAVAQRLTYLFADLPASQFGPMSADNVRSLMVSGAVDEKSKESIFLGWTRKEVNRSMGRLRRMFKWAVSKELVDASVWHGLQALEPLRRGKTSAKDREPVRPVDFELIRKVLPFCSPTLRAMLEVQMLTGMRSESLVIMRPCCIDRTGKAWRYMPSQHKTEWRGKSLTIYLGAKAQAALKPLSNREPDDYYFSPLESEEWRISKLRKKSPPKKRGRPKRPRGQRYTTRSYWRAVQYAIDRYNADAEKQGEATGKKVPSLARFTPHQIRHTVATAVRAKFGLEGAQVYLGHASADATQIYAEKSIELAYRVARALG